MNEQRRRLRLDRHETVGRALTPRTDRELRDLVGSAPVVATGIGGSAAFLEIEDVPVFVKRVPLTELERRPEHAMSTANLFGLPMGCHYGVGSPGFGVWRELAANILATGMVRDGRASGFPLLYHWRVLDGLCDAGPRHDELGDVERMV